MLIAVSQRFGLTMVLVGVPLRLGTIIVLIWVLLRFRKFYLQISVLSRFDKTIVHTGQFSRFGKFFLQIMVLLCFYKTLLQTGFFCDLLISIFRLLYVFRFSRFYLGAWKLNFTNINDVLFTCKVKHRKEKLLDCKLRNLAKT